MSQPPAQLTKLKILVVDDHESALKGTVETLKQQYPDAAIVTAKNTQMALEELEKGQPDLAVVDLSMPESIGKPARPGTGIQLLRTLMERYPTLNIVVQSAHVQTLVQIKPAIDNHHGGFTVADKSLPMQEMLTKVDWALKGLIFTPKEMRNGLEIKPEWLQVLQLAFQESLMDKAIAERIHIHERTVRHYWKHIQDALDVYSDDGKNLRVQTGVRAREAGLLD